MNNFSYRDLPVKIKYFTTGFDMVQLEHKHYKVLDLYDRCSLAIGRGGAGFIYEMMALSKPFITIPIEKSMGDHQLYNAQYGAQSGHGFLLWDDDIAGAVDYIVKVFEGNWVAPATTVIGDSPKVIEGLINQR